MAEFPNLGSHCAISSCNLLDFLPFKCYKCDKEFCIEHFKCDQHECGIKDVRVPVCPLCQQPVPVGKNESADMVVGQHIDNDCKSDPAQKKRTYQHRCTKKGCKKREVVQFTCPDCRNNFCVRHRHGDDHDCEGNSDPRSPVNNHDLDYELARQLQEQENRMIRRRNPPQREEQQICCIS
ncbi:unnamed protein product [Bursaphelenchus okinawaensis]|uniref:AN1-type domain-containing protein n=1 Tax=Bursaphelenchus okinawaensis TaxID=465554 RepID=A0A811KI88_9BILA|nr:unnamed protein product [Bursaphelenchus okinawaensis]CAG9103508.1 unnamed protein product [Bursaphelenchus okinawaensis]